MKIAIGILAPFLIAVFIFLLNILLPGRWVKGYITKKGSDEKMKYRLNGILVFFTSVIIWFLLGYFKVVPYDWLYDNRWYGVAGAFVTGVVFSFVVVLSYPPVRKFFLADLFLGRVENLQFRGGRADAKMWLYLFGATLLGLNVLGFSAHHIIVYGDLASPGIILSSGLMIYFLIDYFIFEEVHLYTYDLFAERVGFKLGWGCLVFYPYFYPIFLWATADLPDPHTQSWLLGIYVLIFFSGWILSRGANLQKFYFKRDPKMKFLGMVPETVSDGKNTLLINGFWGLSRHINYLGEIMMSSGIILCTGYPGMIWPWLYPLYYVILLVTRQIDDDKRCLLKYGDLWNTYKTRVPWRIIPYIY